MVIDAMIMAPLTVLAVIGILWAIGKIHRFKSKVAWSLRKE